LARGVEFEVDHDIVCIINRSQYPVAAHTRPLPASRIAVEGLLPFVKVDYWVFNTQELHFSPYVFK
jgi:hypothetical protein